MGSLSIGIGVWMSTSLDLFVVYGVLYLVCWVEDLYVFILFYGEGSVDLGGGVMSFLCRELEVLREFRIIVEGSFKG